MKTNEFDNYKDKEFPKAGGEEFFGVGGLGNHNKKKIASEKKEKRRFAAKLRFFLGVVGAVFVVETANPFLFKVPSVPVVEQVEEVDIVFDMYGFILDMNDNSLLENFGWMSCISYRNGAENSLYPGYREMWFEGQDGSTMDRDETVFLERENNFHHYVFENSDHFVDMYHNLFETIDYIAENYATNEQALADFDILCQKREKKHKLESSEAVVILPALSEFPYEYIQFSFHGEKHIFQIMKKEGYIQTYRDDSDERPIGVCYRFFLKEVDSAPEDKVLYVSGKNNFEGNHTGVSTDIWSLQYELYRLVNHVGEGTYRIEETTGADDFSYFESLLTDENGESPYLYWSFSEDGAVPGIRGDIIRSSYMDHEKAKELFFTLYDKKYFENLPFGGTESEIQQRLAGLSPGDEIRLLEDFPYHYLNMEINGTEHIFAINKINYRSAVTGTDSITMPCGLDLSFYLEEVDSAPEEETLVIR